MIASGQVVTLAGAEQAVAQAGNRQWNRHAPQKSKPGTGRTGISLKRQDSRTRTCIRESPLCEDRGAVALAGSVAAELAIEQRPDPNR
jgi:hypothetical protein